MGLLQKLGQGQGYAKVGFLGFPKSGKTYTATEVAIGIHDLFRNCENIAFFDTEGGSEYIAHRVKERIGKDLIGLKSRSLADLLAVTRELKPNDIFIVDSVTHVWKELCDSHLASVNAALKKKNKLPRSRLEFQDWQPIKATWAKWADWYLNSPVHVIICGRAGYEYDFQTAEDVNGNERKELVKTGVKMLAESQFGFEPSLLIEMDRVVDQNSKRPISRQAVVIGDRFSVLDGKVFVNPKFKDFLPHIRMLKPDAHSEIDTALKTDTGVGEDGDTDWNRERKTRTILCEEIQGLLVAHIPGQSAVDKKRKADLMNEFFGTRSWTAIEGMPSHTLRDGLIQLRAELEGDGPPPEMTEDEELTFAS